MPRRPSSDSSIAVSSPQTYEPAPVTISTGIEPSRPARAELRDRGEQPRAGGCVLLAQVDDRVLGLDEPRRDRHALDEQMRPQLHDVAVLDRARLALVGVDDDDARPGELDDGRPLAERREAGAAVAHEARRLELREHGVVRVLGPQRLEPAAPLVVGERLVGLREPGRRPVVRRVGDGNLDEPRQDRVAARADRREVAVAEARNLDHGNSALGAFLRPGEQVARAEAVADGAGAHANAVVRQLEVRVERDDLGHLAAADVHVVCERVGELGRHRPDAAADRAEVVEQLRALARQCVHHIAQLLHDREHSGGRRAQAVDGIMRSEPGSRGDTGSFVQAAGRRPLKPDRIWKTRDRRSSGGSTRIDERAERRIAQ